jgi:hypothetical protein
MGANGCFQEHRIRILYKESQNFFYVKVINRLRRYDRGTNFSNYDGQMNMKNIVTFLSFLFIVSTASAQMTIPPPGTHPVPPPGMPPGGAPPGQIPPMQQQMLKSSYPDSTAFNAAFKELFPLIRPTPTIKERAETMLGHMGHLFQARQIDSAKAYDSVMKVIDHSMDEKILFNAYRLQFTAEELKSMIAFFKTPAGKHYLEVESRLVSARNGEIDQYVNKTVNRTVMPMGKQPETPPSMRGGAPGSMGHPGMPPAPPTPPTPPSKN